MKAIGSILMAVLLVAVAAADARATAFVWYSTANVNGNGTDVVAGGAEGSQLALSCDTSLAGGCSWTIDMNVRTSITNWISWATNLTTQDLTKGLVISNPVVIADGGPGSGGSPAFDQDFAGTGGAGPNLLTNSLGARSSVGIAVGSYKLIRFTLSKPTDPGDLGGATISANNATSTGGGATNIRWSKTGIPSTEAVSYAGAANVNGTDNTTRLPVITVTNIPEPATIGLLAIGGLALIRRRFA